MLIIGPSDTLYEGGFFKCHLEFPQEYPLRPPKLKVITDIWHPNIERNGDVCISILHEPGKKKFVSLAACCKHFKVVALIFKGVRKRVLIHLSEEVLTLYSLDR